MHVTLDDITRWLVKCNDNYIFSACTYSVLQEFAVDSEVIMTSQSEIVRKLHVWHTSPYRVLKRSSFITNELDISWDSDIDSIFNGDKSFLPATCAMFELPSTTADPSREPVPPPPP